MKGEAAALSVRAQRCQSHYFTNTPRSLRDRCVRLSDEDLSYIQFNIFRLQFYSSVNLRRFCLLFISSYLY